MIAPPEDISPSSFPRPPRSDRSFPHHQPFLLFFAVVLVVVVDVVLLLLLLRSTEEYPVEEVRERGKGKKEKVVQRSDKSTLPVCQLIIVSASRGPAGVGVELLALLPLFKKKKPKATFTSDRDHQVILLHLPIRFPGPKHMLGKCTHGSGTGLGREKEAKFGQHCATICGIL